MTDNKLFPCYSLPLRDFLKSKQIRYEIVGLHPESKCMFWVYIKNEQLNNALKKWKLIFISVSILSSKIIYIKIPVLKGIFL